MARGADGMCEVRGRRGQRGRFVLTLRVVGLVAIVSLALTGGAACGGQNVEALDPKDARLSLETRRWIADAQDGVIVAKAQRDAARLKTERVRMWREQMLMVAWSGGKSAEMAKATGELSNARLAVAEAELGYTQAFVRFAAAKLRLANAERAMLHDLARYELRPLREQSAEAKAAMGKAGNDTDRQLAQLDEATGRFWTAYAGHSAAGGQTVSFWTAGGPAPHADEAH